MSLSKTAYDDLRWWIDNVESSFSDVAIPNPEIVIATDASSTGWGAVLGIKRQEGFGISMSNNSILMCLS